MALTPSETRNEEVSPGNYVTVRVEDIGTGIPPEVVERVFEQFFTTKPPGQGTGLGLSQVWGFVRQSGGLVRIESTPGLGPTVSLFLPVHDHREAEDPKAKPPPPRAGVQGTVLLVDDEEAARQMAADWLRELGLAVLEARTASEALNLLASSRPDLLVTDVGLPAGMNGRQLAEAAREQAPELPILFITGYTGTEFPPGFEVISKPFTLDELARRVQTMLESIRILGVPGDGQPGRR